MKRDDVETHGAKTPDERTPAEMRIDRRIGEVAEIEARDPLRRRILEALAAASLTPTVLAAQLGAAKESVSRQLAELRSRGLVEGRDDLGDRRKRLYSLTAEGEFQLSQHRAFGAREPAPADPTREQSVEFLHVALRVAVEMRRHQNQLDEVARRLKGVVVHARKLLEDELVVEAMTELATTYRLGHEDDQMDEPLASLERIAFGEDPNSSAALVLPAFAHHQYEEGRRGEERGDKLVRRARCLTSAAALYGRLAEAPSYRSPSEWRERQAWSIASLASNLRARSRLNKSMQEAACALRLFEELDNSYGRSHCFFQLGFCLRLMGDFEGAWMWLSEADALAAANSFEPFRADAQMQLGEVLRCRGETEEARARLKESLGRSENMGLAITQAFAESALGAVAYQEDRLGEARESLIRAHDLFARCEHREGLVLNAKRHAAVARSISGAKSDGEFAAVQHLIAFAFDGYSRLRSPAGMAACQVEYGRLLMKSGGDVSQVVTSLEARLSDESERRLLELDPWVPRVVDAFARETQDEGLAQHAWRLLQAAERRLADQAQEGKRRAAALIGRTKKPAEAPGTTELFVDDMGGEPRQAQDEVPELPIAA